MTFLEDKFIDHTYLKFKVISISRDNTLGSGDVQYTGVGFKPKILIAIFGNSSDPAIVGAGMSDGVTAGGFWVLGGGLQYSVSDFIRNGTGGGTMQQASVASFDSDGFTLSWVRTGSPTATTVAYIACLA